MKTLRVSTVVALASLSVLVSGVPVHAQDQNQDQDSALDSDWAFGFHAAPLVVGVSLRRSFADIWQVQGIVQPDGSDAYFAARLLRTATQKQFWESYVFAGFATGREETEFIFNSVKTPTASVSLVNQL